MASAQFKTAERRQNSTEYRRLFDMASRLYSEAQQANDRILMRKAAQIAHQGYLLKPDHLTGLNLMARIDMQLGHYDDAAHWLKEGLRIKPDSVSLLYSAGQLSLARNQLDKAADYFEQSARISKVATKSYNWLAHTRLLQGDFVEAFRHYRELIKTQSDNRQLRSKLFEAADQIVADFYAEELEQDLLRYLDFRDVDFSQLRTLTTSLLKHKLHLSEAGCPLNFDDIISDTLLLKSLQRFFFCDPIMERLLITVRQSLLFSCSKNLSIKNDLLPFVTALAAQTQLNEGVWYTDAQEYQLTDQLESLVGKILSIDGTGATEIAPALTLVMMYKPLNDCSFINELANRRISWRAYPLIAQTLKEYQSLSKARFEVPQLPSSGDKISSRVRQQYNENPYPRWTDIGYNLPSDYVQSLRGLFPLADFSRIRKPVPDVLVAGSGTGRHAIRLAHYFAPMQITALDLSESALAYALLQARKRNTPDIHFIQGDILNLDKLEQDFDIIECSGVLHHMQHPRQGLQALAGLLRPGGVIKIALYSTTARQKISELRQLMGDNIPQSTLDMRLVRETLLQNQLAGDWSAIYNSADFYSLSACRDLLFHQQEHTFDVLELSDFYAASGLQWLGMLAPPGSAELLSIAGKKAAQLSHQEWHDIEQANPSLFAGMYQFYLQKPL